MNKDKEGSMSQFKHFVILVLSILCVIIILQNTAQVETKLLFYTIAMPRAILLFVTALMGFLLGLLLGLKKR